MAEFLIGFKKSVFHLFAHVTSVAVLTGYTPYDFFFV